MKRTFYKIWFLPIFLLLVFLSCSSDEKTVAVGYLQGQITISPLCPVVTNPPDPNCQPTAETYETYALAVFTASNNEKVIELNPSLDGQYQVELPIGDYIIDFEVSQNNKIGLNNLPLDVTISEGETTTINIDIDTGIR